MFPAPPEPGVSSLASPGSVPLHGDEAGHTGGEAHQQQPQQQQQQQQQDESSVHPGAREEDPGRAGGDAELNEWTHSWEQPEEAPEEPQRPPPAPRGEFHDLLVEAEAVEAEFTDSRRDLEARMGHEDEEDVDGAPHGMEAEEEDCWGDFPPWVLPEHQPPAGRVHRGGNKRQGGGGGGVWGGGSHGLRIGDQGGGRPPVVRSWPGKQRRAPPLL